MSTDAFLLVREAADGLTSVELADALRCSRGTAVRHLMGLKVVGDIESTGACRDGAAIFVICSKPRQLVLPSMSRSIETFHRFRVRTMRGMNASL
jgi:hypothetical protein